MDKPDDILSNVLKRALEHITQSFIVNTDIRERVEYVCRQMSNRACARLLMACMVATIDRPDVDPRKPYTEIGDNDGVAHMTKNTLPVLSTSIAYRSIQRLLFLLLPSVI